MRTLVISDLHLGARQGRDVLRRPEALAALAAAVEGAERLVLLGDVVELREGRARAAMADAEPVLRTIGEALGPRPILMTPGNHDHPLVRPWLRERLAAGGAIAADEVVPLSSNPELETIARWLAPARLEVRYPAADLGDGVWVHHGHYLDRRLVRPRDGQLPSTPADYERAVVASVSRLTGDLTVWLPRLLGDAIERAARFAATGLVMARPIVASLPGAGLLAPLNAAALDRQFRRSGLDAMAAVTHDLAPGAEQMIFGHVHRAGPLAADDPAAWRRGELRLWNAGCWVDEPLLLTGASPPHPYWPGGALWVDGPEVRAVNLLTDDER